MDETSSSPLSPDTTSKLDILGHDGNSLGVDGTEIGILEEPHEVGFGGFLQSEHSRALEAEIRLEVLCDLTHEALEGELSDEELRALLILPDLSQGHSAWAEAMGLLHAACSRGGFTSGLCGQLLAGSLSACRLASCLLGPSHGDGDGQVNADECKGSAERDDADADADADAEKKNKSFGAGSRRPNTVEILLDGLKKAKKI